MSLETCPFCGKPFKRLKSHLPHCKMSPGSKTGSKIISNKPKEIPTASFKHTSNEDKTNKVNTDTILNYPTFQSNSKSSVKSKSKKAGMVSVEKEFLQNSSFKLTNTTSKVPLTEVMSTDTKALKPTSKWLAKREQEMLKQAKLQSGIKNKKVTLISQKEKHDSETYKNPVEDTPLLEKEISSGQKNLTGTDLVSKFNTNRINHTTLYPVQTVIQTTNCKAEQSVPKFKAANVSEQIQNSPKSWTKEYTLDLRIKEQDVSVLKTKTCVWDHIKHGLNNKRHAYVPVLIPIVSAQKVSLTKYINNAEYVLKPHAVNDQNALMKYPPVQFLFLQTSVQRPVKNLLDSQLQKKSVLAYSPEMATGYGGTLLFSSQSELSSNEDFLIKHQNTSKPSTKSQGLMAELRLGDVRLNALASWLGARTPKSPRETVTIFNKGWQWYYRKYIDVQKGGIGGIAMLIGSYCVLSYIWSYPHIKKHRWRKYH